jgi:hypothetical protein
MLPPEARNRAWEDRPRLSRERQERFFAGAKEATRFFIGEADVQRAQRKVARLLEEDGIPYAVIGAMALNAYGYHRVTVDVDLLLTREGLEAFKAKHLRGAGVNADPAAARVRYRDRRLTPAIG